MAQFAVREKVSILHVCLLSGVRADCVALEFVGRGEGNESSGRRRRWSMNTICETSRASGCDLGSERAVYRFQVCYPTPQRYGSAFRSR